MSLKITPIPTASAMKRALDYSDTGLAIDVQYIGVGSGKQSIEIDDAGRAITDTLADIKAWVPVLTAQRVDDYQHQLIIDLAGLIDEEWQFAELALADADKNIIAIYGNAQQALMSISPVVDRALVNVNLVLGLFPAGSINIIHQGLPLELYNASELVVINNALASLTLSSMRGSLCHSMKN